MLTNRVKSFPEFHLDRAGQLYPRRDGPVSVMDTAVPAGEIAAALDDDPVSGRLPLANADMGRLVLCWSCPITGTAGGTLTAIVGPALLGMLSLVDDGGNLIACVSHFAVCAYNTGQSIAHWWDILRVSWPRLAPYLHDRGVVPPSPICCVPLDLGPCLIRFDETWPRLGRRNMLQLETIDRVAASAFFLSRWPYAAPEGE